jgi:hypothetical protein
MPAPESPESAPDPIPSVNDFISCYADYADILEAPRGVHEAVALILLAAVLNPRVSIRYGGLKLTLDLWELILSESGMGRNTLVGLMYPIIDASRVCGLVRGNTWGSGPAFYEDISKNSDGLFIWPEISQVLRTLNQSNFTGVKEWLTDRYDNTRAPDDITYRTGRPSSTLPIEFRDSPRITILATSSLDWFVPNLAQADSTGGFVPRWLIVRVPGTTKVISKPKKPNTRWVQPLGDRLRAAAMLRDEADLSGVEDLYDDWYVSARKRFTGQSNCSLAMPFFHRLRAVVLKLAVIFEVSASCSLRVSPAAMQRAIDWVVSSERTVFELIQTGLTPEGFAADKMEQKIRQAGAPGITQSELTRAFQGDQYRDRKKRLTTLVHAGKLSFYGRLTAGRKAIVYVHSDFRVQHEKDFPTDTLIM